MAIKLNDGTILRNLEEQVQYLTNYHDVNQGLAQWGIRVVGQVETAAELPDPATFTGEYGDTYAVGTEAPFSFYIFTRAAIQGENPYWFPFGEISIVGPQGPKGDKGDTGATGKSTRWYTGTNGPTSDVPTPALNDLYLFNGAGQASIYQYNGTSWIYIMDIRGPQGVQGVQGLQGPKGDTGAQGPKGDTGDVGGFINIWGILTDAGQLPTPASLNNLTVAYLVTHTGGTDQANDHYDLYIQVGNTSATAVWENVGPFNAATLITVGGVGQNVWNADDKLDKVTTTSDNPQAYIKTNTGVQTMYDVSATAQANVIVRRDANGYITVPLNPRNPNNAVSLHYLTSGNYTSSTAEEFKVMRYGVGGTIQVGRTNSVSDALNKGEAQETFNLKSKYTTITLYQPSTGNTIKLPITTHDINAYDYLFYELLDTSSIYLYKTWLDSGWVMDDNDDIFYTTFIYNENEDSYHPTYLKISLSSDATLAYVRGETDYGQFQYTNATGVPIIGNMYELPPEELPNQDDWSIQMYQPIEVN